MLSSEKSNIKDPYCIFFIAVGQYKNHEIIGRLFHSSLPKPTEFNGIMELAVRMFQILEACPYPMAGMTQRRFKQLAPAPKQTDQADQADPNGQADVGMQMEDAWSEEKDALAVFRVQVTSRRNASIQGGLKWMDGNQDMGFTSFMDLVQAMGGILEAKVLEGGGCGLLDRVLTERLFTYSGGDHITFAVHVIFHENSTCQGMLLWSEGKEKVSFRSFMELLLLMDMAISNRKSRKTGN